MVHPQRLPKGIAVLLIAGAVSIGAIGGTAAEAAHWHTNCAEHGLQHGSSTTDGSYFAAIYNQCGNTLKTCNLYGNYGATTLFLYSTYVNECSAWSKGNTSNPPAECTGNAHVDYDGVFVSHEHNSHVGC